MDILNNIPVTLNSYVRQNKKGIQNENEVEKGIVHIIASVIATSADVLTYLRKLYKLLAVSCS